MSSAESKTISAVLNDKQIHLLFQANVDSLFKTHSDVWNFIRTYFEKNMEMPPADLVVENFRDFDIDRNVGTTKHHLEELRSDHLKDSLTNIPLVDPKYSLNTDFIFDDAGYSALLREISRTPGVIAWTQEIITEGGKNIIKTSLFSQYADEDIVPDKSQARSPIPGSEIIKYVSGIIPPAAREDGRNLENVIGRQSAYISAPQSSGVKYARRKDREQLVPKFEEVRLITLALLRALIQKDFTIGGNTGAVRLEVKNEQNARYARDMFIYSEILRLNIEAMKKAIDSRSRIFSSGPAYLSEAFQGSMDSKTSEEQQILKIEEEKYINGLRSAMDKNQDIADRISQASTDATTQFISFVVASGVFVVLASYPVFSSQ